VRRQAAGRGCAAALLSGAGASRLQDPLRRSERHAGPRHVLASTPRRTSTSAFVTLGVSPADALRCGTAAAMEWFGEDLAATPASVATFVANPRDDPEILRSPAAVVLGGVRVRVYASRAGRQVRRWARGGSRAAPATRSIAALMADP